MGPLRRSGTYDEYLTYSMFELIFNMNIIVLDMLCGLLQCHAMKVHFVFIKYQI